MRITAAATVLPVTDFDTSFRYFTETLGFSQEFRFDGYAGVERGSCLIHLSRVGNPNTGTPGSGAIYVFCDGVDEIYREFRGRGASIDGEPRDYPYRMRDFVVYDPDNNRITFGAPTGDTEG